MKPGMKPGTAETRVDMETHRSSHEAMEPLRVTKTVTLRGTGLMSWTLALEEQSRIKVNLSPADRKKKKGTRWKVRSSDAKQVKTGTSEDLCEIRDVPVSALKHGQKIFS